MNNEQEIKQAEEMVGKPTIIEIGKRKFAIQDLKLGTIDLMTTESLRILFDDEDLQGGRREVYNEIISKSVKPLAQFIAYAILNDKRKIKWFGKLLTTYILNKMTSAEMFSAVQAILLKISLADFIYSIKLTAGVRTTKPNLIENQDKQA